MHSQGAGALAGSSRCTESHERIQNYGAALVLCPAGACPALPAPALPAAASTGTAAAAAFVRQERESSAPLSQVWGKKRLQDNGTPEPPSLLPACLVPLSWTHFPWNFKPGARDVLRASGPQMAARIC